MMNLRKDRKSETKNLIDDWAARREKVNQRKRLEPVIAQENEKMQKAMVELVKPICAKAGFGLHIRIKDDKIEISTQIIKFVKEGVLMKSRLSIDDTKIEYWLDSEEHIEYRLKNLEKQMRYLKRLMKGAKVSLTPKNQITVGIETRNRYF